MNGVCRQISTRYYPAHVCVSVSVSRIGAATVTELRCLSPHSRHVGPGKTIALSVFVLLTDSGRGISVGGYSVLRSLRWVSIMYITGGRVS